MGFFVKPKKQQEIIYRIDKEQNYEFLQTISRLPFIRAELSLGTANFMLLGGCECTIKYGTDSFSSEFYDEGISETLAKKKLIISKDNIDSETEISANSLIENSGVYGANVIIKVNLQSSNGLENEVTNSNIKATDLEEKFFPQFMKKDLFILEDLSLYINKIFVEWHNGFISVDDAGYVKHGLRNKDYTDYYFKKFGWSGGKEEYHKLFNEDKRLTLRKLFRDLMENFDVNLKKKIDKATKKMLDSLVK